MGLWRGIAVLLTLGAPLAAQDRRPAAPTPWLRLGEGTSHPWPLDARDRLWVVTADPFVGAAADDYFVDTTAAMQLLVTLLAITVEDIDASPWAQTNVATWRPLRKRVQQVLDLGQREHEAASRPTEADIDGSERSAAAAALRALTSDPLWHDAPIPATALGAHGVARWRAFHRLVRALWGDPAAGWPGWLVRVSEPATPQLPPPAPGGEGLLPRVPDRLTRWDSVADPLLDAPAWGPAGVFADLERTTSHLRSALDRVTAGAAAVPSQRDALYPCLSALVDEHEDLIRAVAGDQHLTGMLTSSDWRAARTESVASLLVQTRYSDQRSLVFGSPFGRQRERNRYRVFLLVSRSLQTRLEQLAATRQRCAAAWRECVALLPAERRDSLRAITAYATTDLLDRLRRLQRTAAAPIALTDDDLRDALAQFRVLTLRHQFEAPIAAPDAPDGGAAAGAWTRVRLAGRGLRAVEFRVSIDGDWCWGRGAMAQCEVQRDGAWQPLPASWNARR